MYRRDDKYWCFGVHDPCQACWEICLCYLLCVSEILMNNYWRSNTIICDNDYSLTEIVPRVLLCESSSPSCRDCYSEHVCPTSQGNQGMAGVHQVGVNVRFYPPKARYWSKVHPGLAFPPSLLLRKPSQVAPTCYRRTYVIWSLNVKISRIARSRELNRTFRWLGEWYKREQI